jgi:hypothetical protein
MEEVHCRMQSTMPTEKARSFSIHSIKKLMTLIVSSNGIYPTLEAQINTYRFIYTSLSISYRRIVQRYGGGSKCLDSMRRSPAWTRDDLSGPLPFGQSDNDCRSDDEGSRPLDLGEVCTTLAVSFLQTFGITRIWSVEESRILNS